MVQVAYLVHIAGDGGGIYEERWLGGRPAWKMSVFPSVKEGGVIDLRGFRKVMRRRRGG